MLSKLLKTLFTIPQVMLALLTSMSLSMIAQSASSQTSCPDASVHGTTSPVWRYAYHNAVRGTASCSRSVGIPANGVRVFSSRADCRAGRFVLVGENAGGILADSLTCTNCTSNSRREVVLAVNSSAQVSAQFTFPDGQKVRYSATMSRGTADANGRTLCSISGAVLLGGGFGGDLDAPMAALGAVSGPTAGRYTVPVTLSEPSTDFTVADLDLVNATATMTGNGTSYSLTITPTSEGTWSAQIKASSFTDDEGDLNTAASNRVQAIYDVSGPTASIADITPAVNGTFTADITLSEPAADFTLQDLTVSNATATLAGSGARYTAALVPASNGVIGLSIAAGVFTDSAGNANLASNIQTLDLTSSGPNVVITGLAESFAGVQNLSATITFSKAVSGFEANDLNVQNATVTGLMGGTSTFHVTLRTLGTGDVSLYVPAGRAVGESGRGNTRSNTMVAKNGTAEETQKQIAQFLAARANQLVSNQPDLTCMMSGACAAGGADLNVSSRGMSNFQLSSRSEGPLWFRLKGSQINAGGVSSDYVFGAIGAHRAFGSNALVGLMLQFDHLSEATATRSISGTGWMAGPYLVGKLPRQKLFYELRALAGKTRNDISPFGTYSDRFETKRFLVQAKVAGALEYGTITVTPSLSATYSKDTQAAYTDTLGNLIAQQSIELGQVSLGLDVSKPVMLGNQIWTLRGGLVGVYTSTFGTGVQAAKAAGNGSLPHDRGRARVHVGALRTLRNGGEMNVSLFYDGLGAVDYEAYGVDVGLKINF